MQSRKESTWMENKAAAEQCFNSFLEKCKGQPCLAWFHLEIWTKNQRPPSKSLDFKFLSTARGVRHTFPSPGSAAWHSRLEVGSLTIFWEGKAMQVLSLAVMKEHHCSSLALQHGAHSALSSLASTDQDRSWRQLRNGAVISSKNAWMVVPCCRAKRWTKYFSSH